MVRRSPAVACQPRSTSLSIVPSCSNRDPASMTVTRLCRLATSLRLAPVALSWKVNVSATGSGSEMPEDSTST